jgi:hypothetical protein
MDCISSQRVVPDRDRSLQVSCESTGSRPVLSESPRPRSTHFDFTCPSPIVSRFAYRHCRFTSEGQTAEQVYPEGKVSPYLLAETYSKLGNSRQAVKYLALACDHDVEQAIYLASFQQLVAKIGLPPVH